MDNLNLSCRFVETESELQEALKLRHDVFNVEIKGQAGDHQTVDRDRYDDICDHLIIVDRGTARIVGTYRLLRDEKAFQNFGFYSETKFNLKQFKNLNGGLLEVGRSCVHKRYRNRYVLNLLWQGIANYVVKHKLRYIFGSANIMTGDVSRISQYYAMFQLLDLFEDYAVTAAPGAAGVEVDQHITVENPKELFKQLPTLFKGYMKMGLKVCGRPVWGDFGTGLFPVLLDIEKTSEQYKKRFFGDHFQGQNEPSIPPKNFSAV